MGSIQTFRIEPRFTPGSPVLQRDVELAKRVAQEERAAYYRACGGAKGDEERTKAFTLGLGLIVFEMREVTLGWKVKDLITNKMWFWPHKATCSACNVPRISCERGHLRWHQKHNWDPCDNRAFVGRPLQPNERW